jgi:hypothetical protein
MSWADPVIPFVRIGDTVGPVAVWIIAVAGIHLAVVICVSPTRRASIDWDRIPICGGGLGIMGYISCLWCSTRSSLYARYMRGSVYRACSTHGLAASHPISSSADSPWSIVSDPTVHDDDRLNWQHLIE